MREPLVFHITVGDLTPSGGTSLHRIHPLQGDLTPIDPVSQASALHG